MPQLNSHKIPALKNAPTPPIPTPGLLFRPNVAAQNNSPTNVAKTIIVQVMQFEEPTVHFDIGGHLLVFSF